MQVRARVCGMTEEIRMAMTLAQGAERLTALSAALLSACRKEAFDGTVLFTPDGVGNTTRSGCAISATSRNRAAT